MGGGRLHEGGGHKRGEGRIFGCRGVTRREEAHTRREGRIFGGVEGRLNGGRGA